MKYIRTEDGVYEYNNKKFKYITKEEIVDAGYGKILPKGTFVEIGKPWMNFYGRWISIYDKNGNCYDIRPEIVKEVIEEIKYKEADTIDELCDGIIMTYTEYETEYFVYERLDDIPLLDLKCKNKYFNIYGFIETDKGLIYVAKMNEKGKMELI